MVKGKIIVIEGTDASGKETQTSMLIKKLNLDSVPCTSFSFPRYETPTGNMLKRYLGKEPYSQEFGPSNEVNPRLASVLYAEDRFNASQEIWAAKDAGNIVVLNRYVESNMGHQGGKIRNSVERRNFISWLEELEYGTFRLPKPDKVIFLYMPHEVAIKLREGRGEKADGHESNKEHLLNAEQTYLELAERYGWTRIDCAPDKTLASLRTIEDIGEDVLNAVREMI